MVELVLHDARAPAVDLDRAPGAPSRSVPVTSTDSERRSGNRSPGNERQPSDSSSGSGSPGSSGRIHSSGLMIDPAPRCAVIVGVRVRVDAQRHADLRGGEPDAGRGIHRLEHVGDERADLVRDLFDGRRGGVQDGIAHDANRQNGHALSLPSGIGG